MKAIVHTLQQVLPEEVLQDFRRPKLLPQEPPLLEMERRLQDHRLAQQKAAEQEIEGSWLQ